MMNKGVIDRLYGAVKSGKEAKIYAGVNRSGEELAVKIYLTVSAEFRRGMVPYIEGDIRFKHVRRDTKSLVYAWALKEFKNLRAAYDVGVKVPIPYTVVNNVLVMEFIGKKCVPAPLIKDGALRAPERVYGKLLNFIKLLYRKGKLVHGDLSEYNVMIKNGEPVIFDMSQAVLLSHPMADQLLRRDIANLNNFFKRQSLKTRSPDELHKWIVGNDHKLQS